MIPTAKNNGAELPMPPADYHLSGERAGDQIESLCNLITGVVMRQPQADYTFDRVKI